jgi:glyoxylate utilization-related uncharacterized protein
MYIPKLPKIEDKRGKLTFVQAFDHIPFEIEQLFCSFNNSLEFTQKAYQQKSYQEVIIALSGSFDVIIKKNTENSFKYSLNTPYNFVNIPADSSYRLENFVENTVSLHLLSKPINCEAKKNIQIEHTSINDCRIIKFDVRENRFKRKEILHDNKVPFKVKRVYYLYDMPKGANRGGHAHFESQELLIAVKGSFEIEVLDGKEKTSFLLNNPHQGLYFPSGLWSEVKNISEDALCLVLSSITYKESDYIRDFKEFIAYKNNS